MKQYEQVIEVMRNNGGYATLGFLNQHVDISRWNTKTPFASIRRIVQNGKYFFKIKPGLWALNENKRDVLATFQLTKLADAKENEELNHYYYQGLLVELGKMEDYEPFVPNQDKNKRFLHGTLGEIASKKDFHQFGYEHIVNKARTVDVCWFNVRNMPHALFEVEHTTVFHNSLLKFLELQDYNTEFFIVSDKARKMQFLDKIANTAFLSIKQRVQFMNYDQLSELHAKTSELLRSKNTFKY